MTITTWPAGGKLPTSQRNNLGIKTEYVRVCPSPNPWTVVVPALNEENSTAHCLRSSNINPLVIHHSHVSWARPTTKLNGNIPPPLLLLTSLQSARRAWTDGGGGEYMMYITLIEFRFGTEVTRRVCFARENRGF